MYDVRASEVIKIEHRYADVWIATDHQVEVDYAYGGTRMVSPRLSDNEVRQVLERLMISESTLKNRLINITLKRNVLDQYKEKIPGRFLESIVGGARCVIKPKNQEIAFILDNPSHPEFDNTISQIFEPLGELLNQREGRIKLTPDFGHFAHLSDILCRYTPHVLGVSRANGGCGGKTSFSSTGVLAALKAIGIAGSKNGPITLIGSAGAMGSDILAYFLKEEFSNIAVCDLTYDDGRSTPPSTSLLKLPSEKNTFTDPCLRRGGVIVATTVGQELERSNWQFLPQGTKLLLAHNLAIPWGLDGISLMKQISQQGVFALPGQILTLGGALTSRLEWFWRESKQDKPFDKQLAQSVVQEIVTFLIAEILRVSEAEGIAPYEAMLQYAGFLQYAGREC